MKYIFVINPAAGKVHSEDGLLQQLKNRNDFSYDIYYTKGPKDATYFVDQLCKENSDQKYCFVAVGGDGTLNEVINGIAEHENACFSCWPVGSGNDYVKYFGKISDFLKLDNLLSGEPVMVDAMKVAGKYAVNVINVGFEVEVVKTMEKVKRKPIIGGNNSYTTGIVKALATSLKNDCRIKVDEEDINPKNKYILATFANGSYCGGGYQCAPRSLINDGLMEVCLVKPMPLVHLVSLISEYKKGIYLDNPKNKDLLAYRKGKKVELSSNKNFTICVDGELFTDHYFCIENLHNKLTFIAPKGSNSSRFTISHSQQKDIDKIMAVYQKAREFMKKTGNPNQWGDNKPEQHEIEKDIANNNHYCVMKNNEIVGCFSLIAGQDPTYGYIEGNWLNDLPYATIHKVASAQKAKGVFAAIVKYAFENYDNVRIDTHNDNKIMQHNIEKNGFSKCGTIYLANGDPRIAYQKKI